MFGEDLAMKLRMAFNLWDYDESGSLTSDEIVGILTRPGGGSPMTEADAVAFVKKHDTNKDGHLDLDELSKAMAARDWWDRDDAMIQDVEVAARAEASEMFGGLSTTTDAEWDLMDRIEKRDIRKIDEEDRLAQLNQ